jgi:hypothetical protein
MTPRSGSDPATGRPDPGSARRGCLIAELVMVEAVAQLAGRLVGHPPQEALWLSRRQATLVVGLDVRTDHQGNRTEGGWRVALCAEGPPSHVI